MLIQRRHDWILSMHIPVNDILIWHDLQGILLILWQGCISEPTTYRVYFTFND